MTAERLDASLGTDGPIGPNEISQAAQTVAVQASAGPAGADAVPGLAAAVESGQLTMAQAIDRLVERTLTDMAGALAGVERTELEEVLRQALAADPTFTALRDEQG